MPNRIQIISVDDFPIIHSGDNIAALIHLSLKKMNFMLEDKDLLVISHKIVSKAEGRIVKLADITPSKESIKIAKKARKNPKIVELALNESLSIVKQVRSHLITETKQGWIYSYSGVDASNVSGGDAAVLLPEDPDRSANEIRRAMENLTKTKLGIIISDTSGRPFRKGDINIAIGVSGFKPVLDLRGKKDGFGYTLRMKRMALADELASAAELVIGQTNELKPVAIIRGVDLILDEFADSDPLKKRRENDIFIDRK